MAEHMAKIGDLEICYETFGSADDPALLLVMGLGTQMIGLPGAFCGLLAERGYHVIRYDNRDAGRSTHLDFPPPTVGQLVSRRFRPEQYRLEDMADDTAGLIEALELGPVHLVGASMGGMIAQVLAARRPDLIRSFTSYISNTGSRVSGQPALGLLRYLLRQAPHEREAYIEHSVALFGLIGSDDVDPDETRELAALHYDRDDDRAATGRQLAAILKTGNRARLLRRIKAPTVVIHGTKDRLVRPSGGKATARLIPGARLITIERMGHDLPRWAWPRITDAIAQNARRAAEIGRDAAAAAAA
jgi:pimeloyl-ACP methyl ester carboxylesterase